MRETRGSALNVVVRGEKVSDEHLDDHTPSMRELVEDAPADRALIKQNFFSRLPQNVTAIFALMVEISSANHLATSADRIVDIVKQPASYAPPQPQAEVSTFFPMPTHDTNQSSAILQTQERLTKEVKKLNVIRFQSP